jgi:hypothetical protein
MEAIGSTHIMAGLHTRLCKRLQLLLICATAKPWAVLLQDVL